MSRFVSYSEFGSPANLRMLDVTVPDPEPGQVRVRTVAVGLNPIDAKIFRGLRPEQVESLPSGVATDFSGVVDALGSGATRFDIGDAVLGGARNRAAADYVVIDEDLLFAKPDGVPFDIAGALFVAGRTAFATVASLDLDEHDTVLVSAAAGGVGVIAAQLALARGAAVIGTAGASNLEFLRSLGVIAVDYRGADLAARVRAAAPSALTAVLDNNGGETIDAGLTLGVPPQRINTIANHARAAELGLSSAGQQAAVPAQLVELLQLIAAGEVLVPIEARYPLADVATAYERLEQGHARGKIVLETT